jgi:dihydrofolate synthase/folylpolyglutamate synthase
MPDSVARFHDAVNRLDALIVATPAREDTSREAIRQRARERMTRLRAFLEFLGSPAADIPKVHVGGTSGKGSTTTAIAAILAAAGYRTGVHTSPYLQVASEKLQVDGELIEADRFARLVDHLLDRLSEFPMANHITYGDAWIALVMLFL